MPAALSHLERAIAEGDLFFSSENMWPPPVRVSGPEVDASLTNASLR